MSDRQRRLRISYVIGSLEIGGSEKQLTELARRLDPARFAASVFCLVRTGPLETTLKSAGVPIEVVGFSKSDLPTRPDRVVRALRRLVSLMRRYRPQIVHAYLFQANVLSAYASRLTGVPVVIAGQRGLVRKHSFLLRTGEATANALTDLVIANSEAVRQDFIRKQGLAPSKIVVVPNGIDVAQFDQLARSGGSLPVRLENRRPVVAVVANLWRYKGHEHFLRAWRDVVSVHPRGVALLIGEGLIRCDLERYAASLRISEAVCFLGTRRDVPALLRAVDVVVHPSLSEGLSNALLEAMAAGRPIIATRVGGNPEVVLDGRTGILVEPADSDELTQAMLWLLARPSRAAAMGVAGRLRVEHMFSLRKMVDRHEEIYEQLVREALAQPRHRR